MVRTQIVALSLGAAFAAVIGGVLIWQGLPGSTPQPAHEVASQPVPKTAPPQAAATVPPSATHGEKQAVNVPAGKSAPAKTPSDTVSKPAVASPSASSSVSPKPSQPAPAAAASTAPETVPQFDTVRVEPSGESVVAGHGPANRKVTLLAGDKVIGDAKTENSGDFVIVPQPLAPGNYVLSLRSGKLHSRQSVTVSVPAKGKKGLVVALSEPGKPSVLLADPTAPSAPAAKPALSAEAPATAADKAKPAVAIKTAEVDKGGFYASGFAPPGTHVRIYLNGSALADVTADAKGQWSLTIGKGMTAGHYVVRADALDATGKVIARAQVPFDMPATVAANDTPAAAASALGASPGSQSQQQSSKAKGEHANAANSQTAEATASSPVKPATAPLDASHAVVAEVSTAKVVHGDSLWRISRETLGHGIRYTLIYKANESQIRDPNLIYPGQVFVVPHVN